MKVFIERTNQNIEVNNEVSTVSDLLKFLNVNPTTVIISRNDVLITDDTKLNNKDSIKLLSVISGG